VTERELYEIYSRWSGELHFFTVRDLGRHVDCEYFPDTYEFKLYSGYAEDSLSGTVPTLIRPPGERSETVRLYRTADRPTQEQLTELFKTLCLAAARVLKIPVGRKQLEMSESGTENQYIAWTATKTLTADGTPGSSS
jgi:hypothetical protein